MDEDQKWLIVRVGLVIGVIGLIAYGIYSNNQNRLDITKYNKDAAISANADNGQFNDVVLGDANAKITVIEYADYQCPACGRYAPVFEKLTKDYPGRVKLVFRNFILPGHTDARAAAGVALAADRQGKFWEMHHKLFATQRDWVDQGSKRTEVFENLAKELGLDLNKFRQDLADEAISKKIKFDMELGRAHNLNATPTIVVNGELVPAETWSNSTKLKQLIDTKLQQK